MVFKATSSGSEPKKKLLLFLTNDYPEKTPIMATLAWLANPIKVKMRAEDVKTDKVDSELLACKF